MMKERMLKVLVSEDGGKLLCCMAALEMLIELLGPL
jgi:hypothetical protein